MNTLHSTGRPNRSGILATAALGLGLGLGSLGLCVATALAADLSNAALPQFGAGVTLKAGGKEVKPNSETPASSSCDGDVRSRAVVSGVPYTFRISLAEKMPVEKLQFCQSGYPTEAMPKDISIRLDDGTVIAHTLDTTRPMKKVTAWQAVPVGKDVKVLEVTVLSMHPQPEGAPNWGGIGEIQVLTSVDLAKKFAPLPDEGGASFVHAPDNKSTAPTKATLPEAVPAGEHPRLLLSSKEVKALHDKLNSTEKGKATLATFMKMADTYKGLSIKLPSIEDTVAEKAGKTHNGLSYRVQALGLAYAFTGDVSYAKPAAQILLEYAKKYESYPRHSGRNKADSSKITFQRLSESMWLIPMLQGLDYIYTSGVLSDEDKKEIEKGLIRPAIAEIRREVPADEVKKRDSKEPAWRTKTPELATVGKYPNWLNFYSGATIMAGAVLDDQNMIDLACADLRKAIATGIGSDGMWGEGAIGYQLFAMGVMSPAMETAAHQGIDLWNTANGRFKELFDSPLRYAYPDGTMPGINDSGRGRMGSWQTIVYDYGFLRYGDPTYASVVNSTGRQLHNTEGIYEPTLIYDDLPEPSVIKVSSKVFESLGYAILSGDDNKYLLMDYGPHGGVHGHPDKLNLLIFASAPGQRGDEIGGEPVFHPYTDKLHAEWTTQSIAHNTMTIDQRSQLATTGRLKVFETTPDVMVMQGDSTGAYPGSTMERTVVALKDVVIDLYTAKSTSSRTYDRTFRFQGKLNAVGDAGEAEAAKAVPVGEGAGYQHIMLAKKEPASAAKGWTGVWNTKVGAFTTTIAAQEGQEIILGIGPDKEQIAIARQTGTASQFAAVYQLEAWGNPATSVSWLPSPTPDSVKVCEVDRKDGSKTLVFISNGKPWEAAAWQSDARVLVVTEKEGTRNVLLGGGSFAKTGTGAGADALDWRPGAAGAAGNYSATGKIGGKLETKLQWVPTAASPGAAGGEKKAAGNGEAGQEP